MTATQLRIEYHPASDGAGAKTPDDAVTVDLADRRLAQFSARSRLAARGAPVRRAGSAAA